MKDFLTFVPSASVTMTGPVDRAVRAVGDGMLKQVDMTVLTDYFRQKGDRFAFGEFWGKLMRAMCLTFAYTKDFALLKKIEQTADEMMALQDRATGEISACPKETQPRGSSGSDLWERKYVLVGLLAYYEISGRRDVLDTAVRLAKYTFSQVGDAEGKMKIYDTGWAFYGIESSSIIDPLMKLYRLADCDNAFDISCHIVKYGACKRENIFDAIAGGLSPYKIGDNGNPADSIAKAYEMTSCFEGYLEYARATDDKKAFDTVRTYWDKVYEEEITLLGSGGADGPYNKGPGTGEQWNLTAREQTNPDLDLGNETCVTVYWMRLCANLYRATGGMKYIEAFETSLYNALLGALRPDGGSFEYFPRFNGTRNGKNNFAYTVGDREISCCSANGPTGLAMVPALCVAKADSGFCVGLYMNMTYTAEDAAFSIVTSYPYKGEVTVTVDRMPDGKTLSLRVPSFARNATLNGKAVTPGAFAEISVKAGDTVTLLFDIPVVRHPAPHGKNRAGDNFVAYTYGSLLLARTDVYGDTLDGVEDKEVAQFCVDQSPLDGGFVRVCLNGNTYYDYQSVGKTKYGGERFMSWQKIK